MIVEVVGGADEVPEVRVVDVADLARLHLALGAVTNEEADTALREAGLGRLDGETGWLDVAALRSAGGRETGDTGWPDRFDAMVDGAREHGWVTEDGASLQVHVESAAGA
jgi:hypothetical protein